jgi:hypothetical protein
VGTLPPVNATQGDAHITTTIARSFVALAIVIMAAAGQALAQESAPEAPREVPSFELQPPLPPARSGIGHFVLAGALDLGLCGGEVAIGTYYAVNVMSGRNPSLQLWRYACRSCFSSAQRPR